MGAKRRTQDWPVREERPSDQDAIRAVHEAAFPGPAEADLVDALRRAGKATVSLVAESAGEVVGHVLFSPVAVEGLAPERLALGLAPLAVLPVYQGLGAGTALSHAGLEACRAAGASAVVVLGHADYYPRFGFVPAARFGLRCEFAVPEEHFFALELEAGALAGARGLVRYASEFDVFG